MSFSVSPGVNVSEIDLTTVIPAVSTTEGAIAGVFSWGPVEQAVLVSSESVLAQRYLTPSDDNFETWMTAASFLAYGNKLYVSRAADANAFNAVANTAAVANTQIKNSDAFPTLTLPNTALYFAKYPGKVGNSLRVAVCDSANAYTSVVGVASDANNSVTFTFPVGSQTASVQVVNSQGAAGNTSASTDTQTILDALVIGDKVLVGNSTTGSQYLKLISKSSPVVVSNGTVTATLTFDSRVSTNANVNQTTVTRTWEFYDTVTSAPGTSTFAASRGGVGDELHVVVVDEGGLFTGTQGQVLEVYESVSRARDAMGEQGGSLYYKSVINAGSQYLWAVADRAGALTALSANVVASTNAQPLTQRFVAGTDSGTETAIAPAAITNAYDVFKSAEAIDISLVLAGKARGGAGGEQIANYLIDNLVEYRKDCVLFVTPERANSVNNPKAEALSTTGFKNLLRSSSYYVCDSGYKYMYDKYNDVYRYVPLNGDIAGLCVSTDELRDPWWSPAGFNRGQIKNIIKLAFNPDQAARDILYKAGVNPVVSFPGQGTVLYGDKTGLSKPSAFDRINVRRLFIVLEKAIATASKFTLFEFNDDFTRAQFRNMVEPYLRDIQGRRGIYDFKVVCDETNNTGEVIDANQFVGDIYVKPAKSINFIQLNFVAVRTGVDFSEVVGQF